jgi:hypothetical protein
MWPSWLCGVGRLAPVIQAAARVQWPHNDDGPWARSAMSRSGWVRRPTEGDPKEEAPITVNGEVEASGPRKLCDEPRRWKELQRGLESFDLCGV